MVLQVLFRDTEKITFKFEPLFNQKIKVMKNLKQNLVRAILCLGVVSVSLVACESDESEDANIISLDQLDDHLNQLDSTLNDTNVVLDDDTIDYEPVDDQIEEPKEDVESDQE